MSSSARSWLRRKPRGSGPAARQTHGHGHSRMYRGSRRQAARVRSATALRYRRHGSPAASLPVKGGPGSVSPRRSVDGGGRALTLFRRSRPRKRCPGGASPRWAAVGCLCLNQYSAPGRAGREASLSLAEPSQSQSRSAPRGRHSESQDLRAGRAEALLALSTALGRAGRRDAGKLGGLRPEEARAGRDRAEPRAGRAPAPACPGRAVPDPRLNARLSGRADQPRRRQSTAAFNAAVSRGHAGGRGSRWHCQPLPNARRRRGNEPGQS